MTLSELATIYCDVNAVGAQTRRTYLGTCTAMGDPQLKMITPQWLTHQKTRGIAPRTWNARLGHLRAMIAFAQQLQLADPASLAIAVPAIKQARRLTPMMSAIRSLVPGEYEKACASIKDCIYGPQWYWLVVVAFFYLTGVRRRQLCELVWSDVDLKKRTVLLRHEGSKTLKQRTLPLHHALVTMLKEYKAALHAFGRAPDRDDQLFSWRNAYLQAPQERLTPQVVSQFFYQLSRSSGVRISAHRLRHTFATRISRHTDNIKQVQFLLTHARVETTLAYIHPTYDEMLEMLDYTPPIEDSSPNQ